MTAVAMVLAGVCALRGMWSPCGLSMLSTITPLGERSRGNSYWSSITWYVLGATVGGGCLGACVALGALGFGATGSPTAVGGALTALCVVVCLASDARVLGFGLPDHPRQVDERWVDRYRPWVYAGGFGWQIGTGITTYVMTSGTYALIAVGIFSLSPGAALGAGVVFGTVRGMSLLIGARVTTPAALRALHMRLEHLAPVSIVLPIAAQAAALVLLATTTGQPLVVALAVVIVLVISAATRGRVRAAVPEIAAA
jgi:hypothetical protein